MYVPGRAAADQRGVGGRWGSRMVRSLLRPPHSPDTAPSGPPHTMRWAVQRTGGPSDGHLCIGLGHPSREQTSRCSGHPTQRTTMRGRGVFFPPLSRQSQPRQLLSDGLLKVLHCAIRLVLDLDLLGEQPSGLSQ